MKPFDAPLQLANENSAKALETLRQTLEKEGWRPERFPDRPIYRLDFSIPQGILITYAQIRDDVQQFSFYVLAPFQTPDHRRVAMAEFLTRVNYGLWIGNFELDFGDGEIRYKSSIDFEGTQLNTELIRNAVYPALDTMRTYLPGLIEVIKGQTPLEAFLEIDGDSCAVG